MQYEETKRTSRGSPSGRYGVSVWRCATQPHGVFAENVRAQPTIAPGNSSSARASPAVQPGAGTASESRKTTTSPVAASQPRLRAPPARSGRSLRTTRAPSSSATAAVRSVDASSTTITSSGAGRCSASEPATEPSIRSALCAGITTLMLGDTVG